MFKNFLSLELFLLVEAGNTFSNTLRIFQSLYEDVYDENLLICIFSIRN